MTIGRVLAPPRDEDHDLIDLIIGDQAGRPGALLGILEKLQEQNRRDYLAMRRSEVVAARTGVPQSQVYGVATFSRSSILIRRGRTPWRSAAAPPARPTGRERCSSASSSSSASRRLPTRPTS